MVMLCVAGTLLVTLKVTVHALCAAIVPPASARPVSVPPHVVAGVALSVSPLGSAAAKATPLITVASFSLVIVIVPVEVAPGAMLDGANAIATAGPRSTVSVADALLFVPAFVVVTLPDGSAKTYVPGVAEVMSTETLQFDEALIVAPVSSSVPPVAVTVPHPVLAFGGDATSTPVGSVSANATPFTGAALELVITMASVDFAPAAMADGETFIVTIGAVYALTVSVADAGAVFVPLFVVVTAPAGSVMV
jgi:hypothetical protein